MTDFYDDSVFDSTRSACSSPRPRRGLRSRVRRMFSRKDLNGGSGSDSRGGSRGGGQRRSHSQKPRSSRSQKQRSMSAAEPPPAFTFGGYARSPVDLMTRTETFASISKSKSSTTSSSRSHRGSRHLHKRAMTNMSVSDLCSVNSFDTTSSSRTYTTGGGSEYAFSGMNSTATSPTNTNTSVTYVDPLLIQAEAAAAGNYGGSGSGYPSSSAASTPQAAAHYSSGDHRFSAVATRPARTSNCSSTVKFTENESYTWLAGVVSADIEYSRDETTEIFDDEEGADAAESAGTGALLDTPQQDRSHQLFLPAMKESTRGIFISKHSL